MIDNDFNLIIDYVNNSPWLDTSDEKIIIEKAYEVYKKITINKTKEKILYRLCGQTGSGKTTQLLKMMEEYCKNKNLNPVILGVRVCSEYHPLYNSLLNEVGKDNIREATNGFALKCMTYVLKLLIENGYLILLDITLLDPIYEKYLLDLLNKNSYKIKYHIMSVSNKISTQFLKKRELETGRKVSNSSSEYFNYILDKGYEYLVNNDTTNYAYIWNAFDLEPKYVGLISNSNDVFIYNRVLEKEFKHNEKELVNAKILYLLNE